MKQHKQQADTRPRKRWIVIGPGILLALVFALQIAMRNHQVTSAPPIIGRQVIGVQTAEGGVLTPEIGYMLEYKEHLGLSDRQIASLENLQEEWNAKSQSLKRQMDRAAGEFRRFMNEAGSDVSVRDIQSHAGSVSELSGEVSGLRGIYWQKALQVLDRGQRSMIEQELSQGARTQLAEEDKEKTEE